MKKIFVVLTLVVFATLLVSSTVFAMTDSFRSQATAGMFGADHDDAADNIDDPTDTVTKFPKWVLLTRFSNLLNNAGSSSDHIFEYGAGSNSPNTFYGLMGSSEWFETNLNMPINFAVSFERDGSRTPLLDIGLGAGNEVTSANGDGYGTTEYTNREMYETSAFTETNFTVGYKVSDMLAAGINWKHTSDSVSYVNSGETDDGTLQTTYGNGMTGTVLTLDGDDTFNVQAKYDVNDDVAVKGYLTLGLHREKENTNTFDTSLGDGVHPFSMEVDNGTTTTTTELLINGTHNAIIFGLAGRVYYKPLYKGRVDSKLGFTYQGGAMTKTQQYVNEAAAIDVTDTFTGSKTTTDISWDTRKQINLDKLDVILGLKWNRHAVTETGKSEVNNDDTNDTTYPDQESDTLTTKTVDHIWNFPIGAELGIKENWKLRVGAAHTVDLKTVTVSTVENKTNTVTKTDLRSASSTAYTYGVGYMWSENLMIDVNAFLQEPSQATANSDNASIFDLATYRNLAISATLTF